VLVLGEPSRVDVVLAVTCTAGVAVAAEAGDAASVADPTGRRVGVAGDSVLVVVALAGR